MAKKKPIKKKSLSKREEKLMVDHFHKVIREMEREAWRQAFEDMMDNAPQLRTSL